MSFGSTSPPPAPNPTYVANAQTQSNISVAIANSYLSNANVVSPQGSSTFAQTGTFTLSDPQYNAGLLVSTTDRDIPIFTQTVTLTTKGQAIYDKSQDMQLSLNTLGAEQLTFLATTLGEPFTLAGLPAAAQSPAAPMLNDTITHPQAVQYVVGAADTSADKEAVIAAILSRLEYQSSLSRTNRVAELAVMGIFPGSEAYENELRVFDFQVTDGRLQAILAGGQEQTRQFAIELQKSKFFNEASDQDFRQKMLIVDFSNRVALQRFQVLMQIADFVNTYRERTLQETITVRTQPLNEITAMLHGGQISLPSFTGFKGGQVGETNVGSYYYQSAQIEQQQYMTRLQQQQAMIGSIAQLGGAIAAAPMTGGTSLAGAAIGQIGSRFQ